MKRIILPFVAGILALAASAPCAHAQLQKDDTYVKNEKPEDGTAGNYTVAAGASSSAVDLKSVNRRALKDFAHTFKKTSGAVTWYKDAYGFMAYCTIDGIKNRSNYDKRGNWLYSIRSYGEKQLPADIRARVKRVYYDLVITGIQEIRVEDKTVYLVYMRDDTVCQTVRITEDDMDVIASYRQ